MAINITLFIIFVLFSAFFSATETAIFSLSSVRLRQLSHQHSQAKLVRRLLSKPTKLLSAIVFGNMLVNIALSSLSAVIFVRAFGPQGLAIAVLVSGGLILFFGEIFPKTVAIYYSDTLSLVFSPIINFFLRVFSPVLFITEKIVNFFSSFVVKFSKRTPMDDEELKTALLLSRKAGHITAEEEEMISYVLEFKDTWVSEILTARIDIQGIDQEWTQDEVVGFLRGARHSKVPVFQESLDNIVGILYVKDVLLNPDIDYHKLIREAMIVPESKKIGNLLKSFLETDERIAIIVDEYGGTEGLVTLEDIKEEIFGELYDEFETPSDFIEPVDEKVWRVHGKTPVKTVNIELELELPENQDTLA